MPTDPRLVRDHFLAAAELPPAVREAYLDAQCVGAELRAAVERLLAAHDQSASILNLQVPGNPEHTAAHIPGEEPGTIIAGRYKLLEEIGEGGMGTVWVAEQTQPVRRKVALKLIKAGMDSKSVLARFEAERQALAMMDHPNIAKVLDGGLTENGRPYFVMEYVKGVPITEYCEATRLSVHERLHLFVRVCQAVQHAHQKGIIHRDLKPSNILVALYDNQPVPKVIDFGLAKAMHQSLTERTLHTAHETVLGTPLYMSPEQAQLNNLDVDTRSDIYSLGVLLYELLTGTTPLEKKRFKEVAWEEIRRLIREEEPPRPSTRLSSTNTLASLAAARQTDPARLTKLVRGELDWIVMRALEKDRSRRYETANGFALDIERYLAGEPVLAVPPSARYRLRKFVRKHRVALTTATAILLLLVAVVALQIRANRDLADKNAKLAAEQVKVERRFELAQRAIAKLHSGVSEDLLLKSDQFKELRIQLLKEAAGFYGDLEKLLEGQADAKSRRLLAEGYFQLAELTGKVGSRLEALTVHRRALALRRELAALEGADNETRLDVARSLGAVGYLLFVTGDPEKALRAFAEQHRVAAALAAESPNEAVQLVLAQSFIFTGRVLQHLGKSADGLVATENAVALLRKLAAANAADTELHYELARSLLLLQVLMWDMGKPAEALAALDNARVILQTLTEINGNDTRFRLGLGATHNTIGWTLFDMGKPAEALAATENGSPILRKLADSYPAATQFQNSLAQNHFHIGRALAEIGVPDKAMEALEKSRAILQTLAESNPTDHYAQQMLGFCYNTSGELLAQIGKPGEAIQFHQKAKALLLTFSKTNPEFREVQRELASSLEKTGLLLSASGKTAKEAMSACHEALAIRQKLNDAQPALPWLQWELAGTFSGLGTVQFRTGHPADAVASFGRAIVLVEQLPTLTPRNHFSLACCYAQLAWVATEAGSGMTAERGVAAAQRAMDELRQAITTGFTGIGRLRFDPSLDTLRSRDDFQKLLKELEMKVPDVAP
jgi:eukaryotic-like serine/threonine-protein kinase